MANRSRKIDIQPEDLERELPSSELEAAEEAPRDGIPPSPVQVDESQRAKQERDSLLERLARLQAEFENYRKRTQREQQDFREYAVAEAVKALLPALDSLELALRNTKDQESELWTGVELTRKQFVDALSKLGLREVPSAGQTFDPQVHQAVEMVVTSEVPDHQVIDEMQKGYQLKGRLLRPAMVRVARNTTQ